jgi:hypothetical protein
MGGMSACVLPAVDHQAASDRATKVLPPNDTEPFGVLMDEVAADEPVLYGVPLLGSLGHVEAGVSSAAGAAPQVSANRTLDPLLSKFGDVSRGLHTPTGCPSRATPRTRLPLRGYRFSRGSRDGDEERKRYSVFHKSAGVKRLLRDHEVLLRTACEDPLVGDWFADTSIGTYKFIDPVLLVQSEQQATAEKSIRKLSDLPLPIIRKQLRRLCVVKVAKAAHRERLRQAQAEERTRREAAHYERLRRARLAKHCACVPMSCVMVEQVLEYGVPAFAQTADATAAQPFLLMTAPPTRVVLLGAEATAPDKLSRGQQPLGGEIPDESAAAAWRTNATELIAKLGGDPPGDPMVWETPPPAKPGEAEKSGAPRPHNGTHVEGHPDFQWDINPELPLEHQRLVAEMLNRRRDAFAFSMQEMGVCKLLKFTIKIEEEAAAKRNLFQRDYPGKSVAENELIFEQTMALYRDGIVSPCPAQTMYASPVTLPPKKDENGDWTQRRMCLDLRAINSCTVLDAYQMPTAERIFDDLRDRQSGNIANWFSTFDMMKGYHQIEVDEESKNKTAFWAGKQLWRFNRMPFGLKNAGACFQRAMDLILQDFDHASAFIDDVMSRNWYEDYSTNSLQLKIRDDEAVLEAIIKSGMKAHPGKCRFCYFTASFLGHTVSKEGIAPQMDKLRAMQAVPAPRGVHELQQVLGLFNYYRRNVPDFSRIAFPLTCLLKKGVPFAWGDDQQHAFDVLKGRLLAAPHLVPPDYSKTFLVQTD